MATVERTTIGSRSPRCIAGSETYHESAFEFLASQLGVHRDEFNLSLRDPNFSPEDRLLIKHDGAIVGHAILTKRNIELGSSTIPARGIRWLASTNNVITELLYDLVRQKARRDHGALVLIRAMNLGHSDSNERAWTRIGSPIWSQCLAQNLPAWTYEPSKESQPEIIVQPWRHDQIEILQSLYCSSHNLSVPRVQRSEAYWTWVIPNDETRQVWIGFHRNTPAGYAIVDGPTILEMVATREDVLEAMLSRIRMEAMDRTHRFATLNAPIDHPAHQIFYNAGGILAADPAQHFYGTIVDPQVLLESMLTEFASRRSLPRIPCELGIVLSDGWNGVMTFEGDNRGTLLKGRRGRSYLELSRASLLNLTFGKRSLSELIMEGEVRASTHVALEVAEEFFVPAPFYISPVDRGSI